MSWFKVDDRLYSHPKWVATPADARGLWVTAGSWSAAQDQDGHVPAAMLAALGHTRAQALALVKSGLWEKAPGGFRFHGWAEFQPTKASKEADREAWREKKRRQRRSETSGQFESVPEVSPGDTSGSPRGQGGHVPKVSHRPRPVPSRPDPELQAGASMHSSSPSVTREPGIEDMHAGGAA